MRFLDFEQPIAELEAKIEELRNVSSDTEMNISEEITRLEGKSSALIDQIFSKLDSWQISQLARHPSRPYTLTTSTASSPILKSCMAIAPMVTMLPLSVVLLVSKVSQ